MRVAQINYAVSHQAGALRAERCLAVAVASCILEKFKGWARYAANFATAIFKTRITFPLFITVSK
jgi:hypothetical protein